MVVVETDKGYISGTVIGEYGKEVSVFRGIPYAAPPLGSLRWKPPQQVAAWDDIRECTQFSAVAPQVDPRGLTTGLPVSEDCLYLNVITCAKKASEKLPVMVWMHGGGYFSGSGNDKIWNNYRLPQRGVIVVSVNTRLGAIGLLAHPLLTEESDRKVSGNYMFLDIIAALEWVQTNIAGFGGDPKNVTIFGESGGGAKVTVMLASPLTRGLVHRAICESGTVMPIYAPSNSLEALERVGEKFFNKLGVNDADDPVKKARELRWQTIMEVGQILEPRPSKENTERSWDAAVDGWLLPEKPDVIITQGKHDAVPLIVTSNLGELSGPGPLIVPESIPVYINMLKGQKLAGSKGYACIFDQVPANWKKEGCVSVHAMELPYVFGDWDNSTGYWSSIFALAQQAGAKSADPGLTDTDKYVSEGIMKFWTQFAKTGIPNTEGLPDWPEYHSEDDKYLFIGKQIEVKSGFSRVASQT